MFNKRTLLSVLTCLGLLSLIGCSKQSAHVGETIRQVDAGDGVTVTEAESRHLLASGKIAGSNSALIQAKSIVQMIDYKTRKLTLKSAESAPIELIAGPEVKNFAQIKAGDTVNVDYLVSVSFEVRKPTAEELAAAGSTLEVAAKAKLGEMPAGGAAIGKIKIATVASIDKATQTIVLNGLAPDSSTTLQAKYPENLAYVKVGDTVVVTTLEAFATNVTRVP